jgi:hypothetical protein
VQKIFGVSQIWCQHYEFTVPHVWMWTTSLLKEMQMQFPT